MNILINKNAFRPDIGHSSLVSRSADQIYPGKDIHRIYQTFQSAASYVTFGEGKKLLRRFGGEVVKKSEFTLLFPQWEFYSIVFSVFLRIL
jgi:hypothetical protein